MLFLVGIYGLWTVGDGLRAMGILAALLLPLTLSKTEALELISALGGLCLGLAGCYFILIWSIQATVRAVAIYGGWVGWVVFVVYVILAVLLYSARRGDVPSYYPGQHDDLGGPDGGIS